MAKVAIIGIQLPPDSTGKITGAFPIPDPDGNVDATGAIKTIYVPATCIVDSKGEEIGSSLLDALERIADSLDSIKNSSELTQAILGG